ncbi:replication enhancer protein [Emilia yellow vein Thailand virus]|uniref:Replication enhancer n=1 Tax=Emilia yellow vein Thailand virus TaxID=2560412 RepID=A0A221C9V8_9GEMI|nr:replication enhancer protein [Emilia sonchifolia yellow vein Thailand virus]ASL70129.1 replication enhancer protein [Emilia sonchifolia yellow vein Thailand virus]
MDSRTGELITAAQAESGVYIWEITNPLYFKITQHLERPFLRNHDIITVQIQFNYNLRKALGIHQCFLTCQIWTRLHPPTWRFLRIFKYQCMKYLNSLGVISINNVIRACNHVLNNVIDGTIDVQFSHIIKFNIY